MLTGNEARLYKGSWVNWDYGFVRGSTLTLSDRDGGLLTAFLALFVAVAGGSLWRIICFVAHQIRVRHDPQDGLHHQQQVVFRNTTSPESALISFVSMIWYWRNHCRRPFWVSLPWVLTALLYLPLLGIASIFSSEVTKTAGNETLILSPNCGFVGYDNSSLSTAPGLEVKSVHDTVSAANYARSCYGNDTTDKMFDCNIYVQPQIPWTSNQNATCPFAEGMCEISDTAAYEMDTGPIDSHKDLGINTPEMYRITYRKVTTCAPLNRHGKVDTISSTDTYNHTKYNVELAQYFFGGFDLEGRVNLTEPTYTYNTQSVLVTHGYSLYATSSNAGWAPIPELVRNDGDVSIVFVAANGIYYDAPVDDPFFPAHIPTVVESLNATYWIADFLVNVMGCVDQHQFCNPKNQQCTPLSNAAGAVNTSALVDIDMNNAQAFIAKLILDGVNSRSTDDAIGGRGSSALRAQETVFSRFQFPLPNNQWQVELSSWLATNLAKLQQSVVEFAAGPTSIVPGLYIRKPTDEVSLEFCNAQKVRSSGSTMNFSVLGVASILVVGTILALVNLFLKTGVGFIQKLFKIGEHRRLQWVLDEKLQLQRMAFEGAGMGTWSGGADSVPVTMFGEKLGGFHESRNPEHPSWGTVHERKQNGGSVTESDSFLKGSKDAGQIQTIEL